LHLVGILFPHINDDARSKSHQIKQDICQMKIKNWIACVQDRGKWKDIVEMAKTFNQ